MYTIGQLAKLAAISTRTLRYYDEIGLLRPAEYNRAGYRLYGSAQVDALQQILFYRALGVGPEEIKRIINAPSFSKQRALEAHLKKMMNQRAMLDALIKNVRKTLSAERGEATMTDKEKFEGMKQRFIDENERKYGAEARMRYGDAVDSSNAKIKSMTQTEFTRIESLAAEINEALVAAMRTGDSDGDEAKQLCELHKRWLMSTWGDYSVEAHRSLAQMYVDDERFAAYYEEVAPGAAVFLRDALMHFLPEK